LLTAPSHFSSANDSLVNGGKRKVSNSKAC